MNSTCVIKFARILNYTPNLAALQFACRHYVIPFKLFTPDGTGHIIVTTWYIKMTSWYKHTFLVTNPCAANNRLPFRGLVKRSFVFSFMVAWRRSWTIVFSIIWEIMALVLWQWHKFTFNITRPTLQGSRQQMLRCQLWLEVHRQSWLETELLCTTERYQIIWELREVIYYPKLHGQSNGISVISNISCLTTRCTRTSLCLCALYKTHFKCV